MNKAEIDKHWADKAHVESVDAAVLSVLHEYGMNTNNAGILLMKIKQGKVPNLKIEY